MLSVDVSCRWSPSPAPPLPPSAPSPLCSDVSPSRAAWQPLGKPSPCGPKVTMTALMLSHPTPLPPQSGDRQSSSSASQASRSEAPPASCLRTKSTTSWLDLTSKMPSQPSTRNSSSGTGASAHSSASPGASRSVCVMISGLAVTACSAAGTSLACLNSESPMARLRLSTPLTRPSDTKHLAASIRAASVGSSGLWSRLSATAVPPRLSTQRLSPQLATVRDWPCTTAATAVQPAAGPCTSPPVVGGMGSLAVATMLLGGVAYIDSSSSSAATWHARFPSPSSRSAPCSSAAPPARWRFFSLPVASAAASSEAPTSPAAPIPPAPAPGMGVDSTLRLTFEVDLRLPVRSRSMIAAGSMAATTSPIPPSPSPLSISSICISSLSSTTVSSPSPFSSSSRTTVMEVPIGVICGAECASLASSLSSSSALRVFMSSSMRMYVACSAPAMSPLA
mmetsp:Transcript_10156/g.31802  ORF Transcript_10156/g.31802 Transcript_10156/m.31802 type:complete len:450 (+) Transcript_10156:441-1790(+)